MKKQLKTLGLLLFLFSCTNDDLLETNKVNEDCISQTQLIFEAQSFFEYEVLLSVDTNELKGNNNDEPRKKIKKTPLWDKAFIRDLSFGMGVVVPISYEKELYIRKVNSSIALSDLSYMLFYIDNKGKMQAELVTSLPDSAFTNSTNPEQVFSGIVLVEDWHGNFLKGFLHKNGSINYFTQKENNSKVENGDCEPEYIDWYTCPVINGEIIYNLCNYNYTQLVCTPGTGSDSPFTNGGGEFDGGDYPPGGGSSGETVPDDDPPVDEPSPCTTGDNIIDNSNIQLSLGNLWASSNVTTNMSERREQGGWIVNNNGKYSFIPFPSTWERTACGINPPSNWIDDIPDNAVAMVHSHPFNVGEDTRPVCGPEGDSSYKGGPSWDDVMTIALISSQLGNYNFYGYVIDGNKISKYNWQTAGNSNKVINYTRCAY